MCFKDMSPYQRVLKYILLLFGLYLDISICVKEESEGLKKKTVGPLFWDSLCPGAGLAGAYPGRAYFPRCVRLKRFPAFI